MLGRNSSQIWWLWIYWAILIGFASHGVVEVLGDECSLEGDLKWGDFKDKGCFCGSRKYEAHLFNIKGSWEETCPNTPGRPFSSSACILPFKCEKRGFLGIGGEWGIFYIADKSCKGEEVWSYNGFWTKDKGCAEPLGGFRRWETQLLNVGKGVDWQECCDVYVRGHGLFKGWPTYMVKDGCSVGWTGVFGTFDIYDDTCLPPTDKQICAADTINAKRQEVGTDKQSPTFQQVDPKGQNTVGEKTDRDGDDDKGKGGLEERGRGGFPVNALFAYVIIDGPPEVRISDMKPIQYGNRTINQPICGPIPSGQPCPSPILATWPLVIGDDDRVERLVACIRSCNLNTGTPTNQAMRNRAHALGEPNDDAGHIVGNQLGGSGTEARNIYPQNIHCNRGNTGGIPGNNRGWRECEDYIRGLAENPGYVFVAYQLQYGNQQIANTVYPNRPFVVSVEVYGHDGHVSGFVVDNPSNQDA